MKPYLFKKREKIYNFFLKYKVPYFSNKVLKAVYDTDFFYEANNEKVKSSEKICKILAEQFQFSSVFDIGCGMGLYINEFHKIGKEVIGCDGSLDGLKMSSKDFSIFYHNVTKPIFLNRKYDFVLCFEVAEHIAKKHSEQLVLNCVNNGKEIIFTSAPKGQGGIGHINEQPYEFWINLFDKHNFKYEKEISENIRGILKKEKVVAWIANNFMYFTPKIDSIYITNE